jgi:hypothetical protein
MDNIIIADALYENSADKKCNQQRSFDKKNFKFYSHSTIGNDSNTIIDSYYNSISY